jgi:hypothetical protein
MNKKLCLLSTLLSLFIFNQGVNAFSQPNLFTLELKRDFSAQWSTLALEIIKNKNTLTSEILILSQSIATTWINGKPAYMVVELYHVHEKDMPVVVRLYSKTETIPLDAQTPSEMKLDGKPVVLKKTFDFCALGEIWSGTLSAATVDNLIDAAKQEKHLSVTLALQNNTTITGNFGMAGFDASFNAGFNWKLHYRPFWEATRLGRFSSAPR